MCDEIEAAGFEPELPERRRIQALAMAIDHHRGGLKSAADIVLTAARFETYLKGEAKQEDSDG